MSFGFAPPLQRRLQMQTGPVNTDSPQAQGIAPALAPKGAGANGGSVADSLNQLKTGLQSMGLMKTPTPGDNLPFVTNPGLPPAAPDIGSADALSSAGADAAGNVADSALSGAGDAAAAGSDIGDLIAELFI